MSNDIKGFLAIRPFKLGRHGYIIDANGDRVLTCDNDGKCELLYAESKIDADPHFICECGRLGQRMEEVSITKAGEVAE